MKNKIFRAIGATISVLGMFWVLGTVGAFQNDNITFLQSVFQNFIGFVAIFAGYRLFRWFDR